MRTISVVLLSIAMGWAAPAAAAQVDAFDQAVAAGIDSPDAAREALDRFLQIAPGPQREQRVATAIRCAWIAGKREVCLDLCEQVAAVRVLDPASRESRLRCLIGLGRWAEFLRLAQASLGKDEEGVVEALRAEEPNVVAAADAAMRAGNVEAGLAGFELLATLLPSSAARLSNWALALRHAGRLDRADEAYKKAIELEPTDSWTWNDYGLLLRVRGDRVGALAAFQKSLQCDRAVGEGPGITNLVVADALSQADQSAAKKTLELASLALAVRPDAALLRRATIDLALAQAALARPQVAPDKAAGGR